MSDIENHTASPEEEFQINDVTEETEIEENNDSMDLNIQPAEPMEILEEDDINIEFDNAFPSLGSPIDALNHALLNNRELPDQHPIEAITNLRETLDFLKSLRTIYSDQIGHANYFKWTDSNSDQEDRIGYFVSLAPNDEITIFDGSFVELGVAVDSAAFVGGQSDFGRDSSYGLIISEGRALVYCESDVEVGDFVVPNQYGVAAKSNYGCGYQVIETTNRLGSTCAIIVLNIATTQLEKISQSIEDLNSRLDNDEININSAINTANYAYQLSNELDHRVAINSQNINAATETANNALNTTQSFAGDVAQVKADVSEAKGIAVTAASTADQIRAEAVDTANISLAKVNDLIDGIEPVINCIYVDPDTGEKKISAEYFVQYTDNGIPTTMDLESVETLTEDNIAALIKSAQAFNTLVSSISRYSLGLYSQSYGLYNETQAQSILDESMIYVPYNPELTSGNYDHREDYTGQNKSYDFSQGCYYTWHESDLGAGWEESNPGAVVFSPDFVVHTDAIQYWVPTADLTYEDTDYKADTLYAWINDTWVEVASLRSNVNTRIVSTVNQTVNNISANVSNIEGDISALTIRLDNDESNINLITTWKSEVDQNIASINTKADASGASVAQVVSKLGSYLEPYEVLDGYYITQTGSLAAYTLWTTKKYNLSNIQKDRYFSYSGLFTLLDPRSGSRPRIDRLITINENGELIKIEETKTDINGLYIPNNASEIWFSMYDVDKDTFRLQEQIDAASIVTAINNSDSSVVISADHVSIEGAAIDLTGKTINIAASATLGITSANFKVDTSGKVTATNAVLSGKITADSGSIGGWEINPTYLGIYGTPANTFFLSRTGRSAYLGSEERNINCIAYFGDKFAIDTAGTLYANNAILSGGRIGSWEIRNGYLGTPGSTTNTFILSQTGTTLWVSAAPDLGGTVQRNRNCVAYFTGNFAVDKSGTLYANNAYISGQINATSGTIGGCTISGGILKVSDVNINGISISKLTAGTNNNAITMSNLKATGGEIYYNNGSSKYIKINADKIDYWRGNSHFTVQEDESDPAAIWATIYCSQGGHGLSVAKQGGSLFGTWKYNSAPLTTSDREKKNSIVDFDERYELMFDKLEPKTFKYNDGQSGRMHSGFIAQQVEDSMVSSGLSTNDFAALCYETNEDGTKINYALRYEEIIALNTWQIQKLKERIQILEDKLEESAHGREG